MGPQRAHFICHSSDQPLPHKVRAFPCVTPNQCHLPCGCSFLSNYVNMSRPPLVNNTQTCTPPTTISHWLLGDQAWRGRRGVTQKKSFRNSTCEKLREEEMG